MPTPEKTEPGAISGYLQQQSAVQFPSTIPIKKRKLPTIQPGSPSPKEQSSNVNANDSSNGQESSIIPDGKLSSSDGKTTTNPDVIKTLVHMIKKEVEPMNVELGASKPREATSLISLGSVDDLRNRRDGSLIGKNMVQGVLNSDFSARTVSVKQEIVSEQVGHAVKPELSTISLNVELPLGPKEQSFLAGSEKLDTPLLSLALSKVKTVLYGHNDAAIGSAGIGIDDRSNWDLNTTMDTWEGSTIVDTINHQSVGGGFNKANDSLGLKFARPLKKPSTHKEDQLVDKLLPTTGSLQMNLQPIVTMNGNKSMKIEPVEHKCSISGCSTNNTGLPKTSFVKKELANNLNMGNILPTLTSQEKIVNHSFIKSEVAEGNEEVKKCNDAIPLQSVTRGKHHQMSSTSASTPVPLLPPCSELSGNDRFVDMISNLGSEDDGRTKLCNVGNLNLEALGKGKSALVDENIVGSCQPGGVAANNEEKIKIPSEIHKDPFGSDSESQEMEIDEENFGNKGHEKYENIKVQEPIQNSMARNPIVDKEKFEKKFENSQPVERSSRNLHPIPLDGKNINTFTFEGKDDVNKTCDATISGVIKDHSGTSYMLNSKDEIPYRVKAFRKKFIGVASAKQSDALPKPDAESFGKEGSSNTLFEKNHRMKVALPDKASGKVINRICPGENNSTLLKEDISLNAAKYCQNIDNKSHAINLSCSSVAETPSEKRSIPNWLLKSRYRNESFRSLEEDIQPPENRDEFFMDDAKKFGKARVWNQSLRNSYMRGRGRGRGKTSGRFGYLHREWDSDHDFVSANGGVPADIWVSRRKHTSSVSNVDVGCNDHGDMQNGIAFRGGRRKEINNGFPSMRRRIFGRDRGDCTDTRDFQPNLSPDRDDCFDTSGASHGHRFIPCSSDDAFDPNYDHQQNMYDEDVEGPVVQWSRDFSSLHGNDFPQMGSKSPIGPQTHLPGSWPFPQRRSPNGPPQYRKRRIRSPNHAYFPNDSIMRMCGSPPPYHARHPYDPMAADFDQEHVHNHRRLANSHRRSSPSRAFSRNVAREDMLDPRETREGNNEFINEMVPIDDRRNVIARWGPPIHPYRGMHENDFQFSENDIPEQHRFHPHVDDEYFERGNNMHHDGKLFEPVKPRRPMVLPRRARNLDDEKRIEEGAWQGNGYIDNKMKRMRF